MRRRILLSVSLILILSLSAPLTARADSFTDMFAWIGDTIAATVTQVFRYQGGALASVEDLKNGQKVYFSCGNTLFAIRMIPDEDALQDPDLRENVDTNRDGEVSAEEWRVFVDNFYTQILNDFDTDNDGFINAGEARAMVAEGSAVGSWVEATYTVYGENGETLYTYSYLRDENGNFITDTGTPEEGVVNGRRVQITLFENGKADTVGSWVPENPDDPDSEAVFATAEFDYDAVGNLTGAHGNLRALGIDYVDETVGRVEFDSAGRITNVYDSETGGTLIATNTYDSMGNNIRTTITEGGQQRVIDRTFSGGTQTSETITENGVVNDEDSWTAVMSGAHGQVAYRSSTYEVQEDVDADGLTETFMQERRRFTIFNSPVLTTEVNGLMLDDPTPPPPAGGGDPAATGTIGYDEATGQYYMEVEVWTNEEGVNRLEETIKVYLDLSLADENTKEAIANSVGQKIIVHGYSEGGVLEDGYILQVIGLGAGPFEKHPLDL